MKECSDQAVDLLLELFLLLFVHMHRGKPLSLLARMIIYAVIPNFCIFWCDSVRAFLLTPCIVFAWGCRMNIKSCCSGLIALFSSGTHI